MFEVGFSEILVIFVLALVVLGPEKLPRVASQVGRWMGRARAMARQFREQLEEEVNLEEVRKAQAAQPRPPAEPEPGRLTTESGSPSDPVNPSPTSVNTTADTFSHAHPTDASGANPNHPTGAADLPPEPPPEVTATATPADSAQRADGHEAYPADMASKEPLVSPTASSHERGT
jgi:sec-independent protein translocase protein TatB